MAELFILVRSDGVADAETAAALSVEIDEVVGDAHRPGTAAIQGQKGTGLLEVAQIAVLLLSAPAVPKLIDVLSSYLRRDRSLQFEFEGPKGKVKINAPEHGMISREDLARAIDRAMGDGGDGS